MHHLHQILAFSLLLWPFQGNLKYTSPELENMLNTDPCNTHNLAFQNGEEVTYKLYYNWNFIWLSAGEVTFSVKEHKQSWHISAVGKTYPSYEWFFKVNDYYSTELDKETLLPKLFIRDIEEGNYKNYNKTIFDQANKKAINYKGKDRQNLKMTEHVFDACMHDMISLIYHLRNKNFSNMKVGHRFPVELFLDGRNYNLNVSYKGLNKNMKVKSSGRYDALHFSPQVIAGHQFSEGTVMDVYVSNDANKIPLLIESPVSVGSVKAVLIDYKGLKHPFTAKK